MPIGMEFADISAVLADINKLATGQEDTSEIVDTSSCHFPGAEPVYFRRAAL